MFRQRDEFLCRQYRDQYGRSLNRFNGTRKVSTEVPEGPRTYERQRTLMFLLMRGFRSKLDVESFNKSDYLGLLTMSRTFSLISIY